MLQDLLTFSDLQHILASKFFLFAFLIVGAFVIYKKWNPLWILILASIFSAFSYLVFVHGLGLSFWGLRGDEITIAAMYNTFAHVGFFSDFAYHSLPPFYPPLFFWIFGFIGKIANFNGIQIAKIATFSSILLFPIMVYALQRWYFSKTPHEERPKHSDVAFILAPLLVWVFVDWDAMILKPYEVITASLSILWVTFLSLDAAAKRLNLKRILFYALSGGILFSTYYLWLMFGAIAVAFSGLFIKKENQLYFYTRLFLVAVGALLCATPYLIPLIRSYHNFGSENWQIAFFTLDGLSLHIPAFQFFSWRGFLMLAGLVSLLWYKKYPYVRMLGLLFLSGYIWYCMGLFTLAVFRSPMQEFKAFHFFDRTVLAFSLSFGLVKFWDYIDSKTSEKTWKEPALFVGLLFLGVNMIFGFFMDDPVVQRRRIESHALRPTLLQLSEYLKNDPAQKSFPLTFSSGIPELGAFVPINYFLYYNQFNVHPASEFSLRFAYLSYLQNAKDAQAFYQISKDSWFGEIDQYILFKNADKDFYSLYFYKDNFPHSAKEEIVKIPKKLISEPYFTKTFENYEFVVWKKNSELKK